MKALVISGGGSKGAFAGGIAEYLLQENNNDYDLYVGTSTGSLLIPFLAIGNVALIKKIYTTIRQESIFSSCPFIIKNKKGSVKIKINHFSIIKQFIKGQKTLGDSTNLRKLIQDNFSVLDYNNIKLSGKEIIVTVANFTKQMVEYKSSNDYDYDDFCDWIWASANLVPLMSILTKDNQQYADGGFGNLIPIQKAIKNGATIIDAIVLRLEKTDYNNPPLQNALEVFTRSFDFMLNQIAIDDLLISKLEALDYNSTIKFYYINKTLTTHSYIFDSNEMKQWWEDGFEYAKLLNSPL